jgi:N-glycosylase/DNA lyase
MKDLFALDGSTKKVMQFGMDSFFPYGGYYQEALFRYYRTHKLGREKK